MDTLEWSTKDKSTWGPGAWHTEPDKMQWVDEATGMPCLIVRNHGGALCGYVGVDTTHRFYGLDYDGRIGECTHDVDPDAYRCWDCLTVGGIIDVHGGLTYADRCVESADPSATICHLPSPGEPDALWWFGFDTAHSGDLCPAWESMRSKRWGSYKDVAYVKAECARLAAQLVA